MAVFYTYEKNHEREKNDFLQMLYHDRRGGQMIRLRKHGDQVDQLSTCDMDELAATGTDLLDTYTSVHTFRGYKRTSDRVFNFCSIFIDLDCHSDDPDQIQSAKMRTVEILEAAFSDGLLTVPTMITDTGRGFGLQYVLKKSIANIDQTSNQKAFYKKIRKALFEKYVEILSSYPQAAQPDSAVLDDSRVCRIPGTYNTSAGTYCRLIGVSGKYYELSDLVQGCHLWDWKSDEDYQKAKEEKAKRRRERITTGNVVSFADYAMPFLSARLDQLTKLQDLRGNGCEGYREQIIFIAYSSLVQLDRSTATEKLKKINERFTTPLDQVELDHIIDETDNSVGIDHKGFYKLRNEYLIERLGLSNEEIKAIGLNMSWKRTAERQAARDKKREMRELIIGLLKQDDRLTYDEIAAATGVSRRKVCTIARDEKLMRYAKAAGRISRQDAPETEIISLSDVREFIGQTDKSAKNAAGSVCVPLEGTFSSIVLTTPVVRGAGGEVTDWYDWLEARSASDAVVREILNIFSWSFCKWSSTSLSYDIEEYLDRTMSKVMSHPEHLTSLKNAVAKMFFEDYGDECSFLFGMHKIVNVLPTVWDLFVTAGRKDDEKKRKFSQRRAGYHQKKHPEVDVATETPEQREARINRHLNSFSDKRFDIIEASDEYQRRLDPDVIRMVKTACMQVVRLKRDFFWIEKQKIQTSDIKQCFNSLTYKDLVVLCERMAHQGTIRGAETPFYYVLQTVWKYTHPDAAEAQADRIKSEKHVNGFNNFESHTYDFDIGKFMEINAIRKITGQSPLSQEEFINKEGELYGNGR